MKSFTMILKQHEILWVIPALFLMISSAFGFELDADILLDKINHRDINGLRRLMMKGVNVNARDTASGNTALIQACGHGYIHMARLLLENGADPNMANHKGVTALMKAVKVSHELVVLLIGKGADVTKTDAEGTTAFTQSIIGALASRVPLEVPRLLLDKGARVDEAPESGPARGYTPLMMAVKNDDMRVAGFLIENGADINHITGDGETPLRLALEEKKAGMIDFLIDHGARFLPAPNSLF